MSSPRSHSFRQIATGLALTLCCCLSPLTSQAQTLILSLRNGDRLTGTLVSEENGQVVITNALFGKLTVPVAHIEGRKVVDTQVAAKPAAETVAATPPKPATNTPPAVVVAAAPPKPKPPKRWNFDLQLGASLQYNQKENELFYGNFHSTYAGTRFRDTFDYRVNYGKTDGLLAVNNMAGLARTEFDIGKKYFIFNAAGAGYDELRKIDLTYDESFGVGHTVLTRTNYQVSADLGASYQRQLFDDETTKEYFTPRLGEKATWKISTRLELAQAFEFYPRTADFSDYRLRFDANLRYLLSSYLNLNLNVIDLYDRRPAAGVTPNDLQVRSTLGVKF